MMTIKQFWNKVNCWGTKPIRKYKVWDCEETPAMKPMDRNTSTSYTSAEKMDTNSKEMEKPMQECPDVVIGWFCTKCSEEYLPSSDGLCGHCGHRGQRAVKGFWIFNPDGSKDYFHEV